VIALLQQLEVVVFAAVAGTEDKSTLLVTLGKVQITGPVHSHASIWNIQYRIII
jgi:hypothetical protein